MPHFDVSLMIDALFFARLTKTCTKNLIGKIACLIQIRTSLFNLRFGLFNIIGIRLRQGRSLLGNACKP